MDRQSARRRSRHDIIMQILKAAKGGRRKTQVMQMAQLSFDQLERYLKALNHADFIIEESGFWKTTEKGLHAIEACEICLHLTEEVK